MLVNQGEYLLNSKCKVCGRSYSGFDCLRCTQQAINLRGFGEETIGPITPIVAGIIARTPLSPNLAKLKLTDGQQFAVPKPTCRLGKDLTNDIIISDDLDAARFHAQITFDDKEGEYILRDLGTKVGTLLNGNPIHLDHAIFGGDLIKIGRYKFYFVTDLAF